VDCCRRTIDPEGGYATPAALVLSVAIAMVASATLARSISLLQLAKSDLGRTETEYALSGMQLQAAAAVIRTGQIGPFHWGAGVDLGFVDLLVEKEADKLTLAAAAGLPPDALARFGVVDAAKLQARLTAAARAPGVTDVGALDSAPLWRLCGGRLASTFGQQTAFVFHPDVEPQAGTKPAWWRIGEVWRVVVSTPTGWRDDRIVRFTGNASHPAAVVARWFSRGEGDGGRCEPILQAVGAA
jgi:hypothetical protein